MLSRPSTILILLAAIGACTSATGTPGTPVGDTVASVLVGDSARVMLEVDRVGVRVGESIAVTARIENLLDREMVLTSSCTSALDVRVSRGDDDVAFEGTENGCGFAITDFPVEARGALVRTREVRAMLATGGSPAPGVYRIRLEPQIRDLPTLTLAFEVERF